MSITYTWKIKEIESINSFANQSDVIKHIHFRYIGQETESGITEEFHGSIRLPEYNEGDDFIPFADITKEKCIEWILEQYNEEDLQNSITSAIEFVKNPPNSITTPNWE